MRGGKYIEECGGSFPEHATRDRKQEPCNTRPCDGAIQVSVAYFDGGRISRKFWREWKNWQALM